MPCEVSAAEKSTTVVGDFVEHLLGPLSSMNRNEVQRFLAQFLPINKDDIVFDVTSKSRVVSH